MKRRIDGKKTEIGHTTEDEKGNMQEEKEEIPKVYERYYQNLLDTVERETEEQIRAEEIVDIIMI